MYYPKDKRIGFVLFYTGNLGGGVKRYINLYNYLSGIKRENYFFLTDNKLISHQNNGIRFDNFDNVLIVKNYTDSYKKVAKQNHKDITISNYNFNYEYIENVDKRSHLLRKYYWYLKSKKREYTIYRNIEAYGKKLGIDLFVGVYSGIIPLYFYLNKKFRPKIIFSNMDSWFSEIHKPEKRYWYRKYLSFNYGLEKADAVDYLSPFIFEGVKNIGLKSNNPHIASCSFIEYGKCFIGNKNKFEVAFSGRFEKDKNPMLYLEAINNISSKYPDIYFHLLGDGSLKSEIEIYVESNNLEQNVNVEYKINPEEILSKTSVFVSLQTTNNYPSQSVLEAMACGNYVIATDVGDTRLFINENLGKLINNDLNELVQAIEYCYLNREIVEEKGRAAREYVLTNHNIEKFSKYYLELINSLYE